MFLCNIKQGLFYQEKLDLFFFYEYKKNLKIKKKKKKKSFLKEDPHLYDEFITHAPLL